MPPRIYRRKHGEALWHCCANCQRWPVADYEEIAKAPHDLTVCGPCRRLSNELLCDAVTPHSIQPPEG